MRSPFSDRVERARERAGSIWASSPGDDFGRFGLRTNAGVTLVVLVSPGSEDIPWQHVSVSTRTRCPTWEEMAWVKSLFFEDEEVVVQFHPPRSQYVNHHPFCLHLWKHNALSFPLPPSIAVGPKNDRELDELRAAGLA